MRGCAFLQPLPAAVLLASLAFCGAAGAIERVSVCFNYSCLAQAEVEYSDAQIDEVRQLLARAGSAVAERAVLGQAVGRLLGWAGMQSPIGADRGGNLNDDSVYGRMDCIDHSRTTTRLLRLIDSHGWLRYHRVLDPALRRSFLLFEHYAAQIEELAPESAGEDATTRRFVVDSWYYDNGHPAAVLPLAAWMAGEDPGDVR